MKVRFDQLAINVKEKKKPTEEDKHHYIGLEHLDSGSLTVSRWGADVAPKGEKLLMKKGDVLFGKRRAYQKKVAIAPFDGIFSAHGMVLRPNERIIDKAFFPLFISSDYFLDAAIALSVGSLSPTINWKDLARLEFELPLLEKQRELAEVLWAIEDTRMAYQRLEQATDELIKSRFIEMFGDPVTNPMGWETGTLADVIRTKASNGFFAKRNAYKPEGNVAVLGVVDVVNRMYSKTTDLPRTDATETDIKKYRVEYGDVLFCRSSLVQAGIGKASIVPKDITDDILFECHVIRLQIDMNKCLPEFIQLLTTTEYCRNQIMAVSKTATMTTVGQDGILATKIYIPSLELQNEFLIFVQQAEKSKLAMEQVIEKQIAMKETVMQESLKRKAE